MEDRETLIRQYAHNRYLMRQHFQWRLNEGPDDDYRIACEVVDRAEKEAKIKELSS